MQIKKFEAKTMAEALRKVKQEFGSEAVILSARSAKKEPGVFGALRAPKVEVTAAKDSLVAHHHEEALATGTYNRAGAACARRQPATSRRTDQVQLRSRRVSGSRTVSGPGQLLMTGRSNTNRVIRGMDPEYAPAQAAFERNLSKAGVDQTLAAQLWQTGRTNRGPDQDNRVPLRPRALLQACIEDRQLVGADLNFGDRRQKIVALVGASGVGKTTTLAKIASQQACRYKRSVAFISLDYYRIAANAELKVYAKVLDTPLAVAADQSAFQEALIRFGDHDLILVDTPGFVPEQPEYLNVLSMLTSAGVAMAHYLLLSAPTREQELARIVKQLDLLAVTGLIFTKLDTCQTFGHLLNLLLRTQIPAAYITRGPHVPEDLETLSGERLTQLILDGTEGLGRNGADQASPPATDADPMQPAGEWYYLANKKTDLYHSPLCESAKRIKATNIERFETRQAAEKERYQPCRLCIPDRSGSEALPAQYAV